MNTYQLSPAQIDAYLVKLDIQEMQRLVSGKCDPLTAFNGKSLEQLKKIKSDLMPSYFSKVRN